MISPQLKWFDIMLKIHLEVLKSINNSKELELCDSIVSFRFSSWTSCKSYWSETAITIVVAGARTDCLNTGISGQNKLYRVMREGKDKTKHFPA